MPKPAVKASARAVTTEQAVKRAKEVFVHMNGSLLDTAALLWTLQQGRVDAVVLPYGVPANKAYAAAIASAYGLETAAGWWDTTRKGAAASNRDAWDPKGIRDVVLVIGSRYAASSEPVDTKGPWVSKIHPMWGKTEQDALDLLAIANVRLPPAYALGVHDPNHQTALEAAAEAGGDGTDDGAAAVLAVLTGTYPSSLALRDEPAPEIKRAAVHAPRGSKKYALVLERRPRDLAGEENDFDAAIIRAATLSAEEAKSGAVVLVVEGDEVVRAIRAVRPGMHVHATSKEKPTQAAYAWPYVGSGLRGSDVGPTAYWYKGGASSGGTFEPPTARYGVWHVGSRGRGARKADLFTDSLGKAITTAVTLAAANPERGHIQSESFGSRIFDFDKSKKDPIFAWAIVALAPHVPFGAWLHRSHEGGPGIFAFNTPEPPSVGEAKKSRSTVAIEEED